MVKKNVIIGTVIFIAVIVVLAIIGNIFSIGYDDFLMEDDFIISDPALTCSSTSGKKICESNRWKSEVYYGGGSPTTQSLVQEGDSKLIINSQLENAKVTYNGDLKNRDLKWVGKLSLNGASRGGTASGTMNFLINGKQAYSKSLSVPEGANRDGGHIEQELLFEAILDIENESIYHIIVNGAEVNKVAVTEPTAMVSWQVNGGSQSSSSIGNMRLELDYLKSRAYYNCRVDNDEVVVRDTFSEGSTFSISNLAYKPVKFCVESYPAIKRSFTEEGTRADIQGLLTRKLANGEKISVAENEAIEIYYIADYKEGMGERCSLDSAFDTKLNKCIKLISEEEDKVEFVNIKEFFEVGKEQLLLSDAVLIGDRIFFSHIIWQ